MILISILWIFAFVFWVIGDTLTTYYALRVFGLKEINPFVSFLVKRWGIKGFAFVKIAAFTLMCAVSLAIYFSQRPSIYSSLMILVPFMCVAVGILLTAVNLSNILDKYYEKRKLHPHN